MIELARSFSGVCAEKRPRYAVGFTIGCRPASRDRGLASAMVPASRSPRPAVARHRASTARTTGKRPRNPRPTRVERAPGARSGARAGRGPRLAGWLRERFMSGACGRPPDGTGHPGQPVGDGPVPQRREGPADQAAAADHHRQHETTIAAAATRQHPRTATGSSAPSASRGPTTRRSTAPPPATAKKATAPADSELVRPRWPPVRVEDQICARDDGARRAGHAPRRGGHGRAGDRHFITPVQSPAPGCEVVPTSFSPWVAGLVHT